MNLSTTINQWHYTRCGSSIRYWYNTTIIIYRLLVRRPINTSMYRSLVQSTVLSISLSLSLGWLIKEDLNLMFANQFYEISKSKKSFSFVCKFLNDFLLKKKSKKIKIKFFRSENVCLVFECKRQV